ncbi:hypothetical protein [Streptomyces armeniacus]|uniref:hypothetical protein n=1 Tax=Streptomyces armeniacus TaxID=83291 RepID=UPI001AD84328|nr:hypothetical protein [Streptomyces armeniacus]
MTAAGGLALTLIGAILKYAVTWQSPWIDVQVLGTILICGGLLGLALAALRAGARRRAAAYPYGRASPPYEDPRLYDGRVCDERYYDDADADAGEPFAPRDPFTPFDPHDVRDTRDAHW